MKVPENSMAAVRGSDPGMPAHFTELSMTPDGGVGSAHEWAGRAIFLLSAPWPPARVPNERIADDVSNGVAWTLALETDDTGTTVTLTYDVGGTRLGCADRGGAPINHASCGTIHL